MVELHLIEEHAVAGLRMNDDCGRGVLDAQVACCGPFARHSTLGTGALDDAAIVGLEEVLPADVDSGHEVTDVRQSFALELLEDRGIEQLQHLAAIEDGRGAPFLGNNDGEEELPQREARQVRAIGTDGARDGLELLDLGETETAEQDRAMAAQPLFDLIAVRSRPRGKIHTGAAGADDERGLTLDARQK